MICVLGERSCFVAHKTGEGFLEVPGGVKLRMDWARWRGSVRAPASRFGKAV